MALANEGREILERCRRLVDTQIVRMLSERGDTALYDILRYHVGLAERGQGQAAGFAGKRVRAAVCLLCCEAVHGATEAAASAAATIELFHSFTLLHDDIADQDEVRRGRQTVWRRWGVGEAIAAGDALFALANLEMSALEDDGVPADTVSRAMRELNRAALTVCEGQHLDVSYEGRTDVDAEQYLAMIERKTAALFAAAAAIGAEIGGAPAGKLKALRTFGHHLGVGYQIRDDMLGIWGDPHKLGKPVGGDLRRNKRSLPIIHALGAAVTQGSPELADRLARGITTDQEAAAAAAEMERLGSRAFCEETARECLDRALRALGGVELCEGPAAELRALASYLMERTE